MSSIFGDKLKFLRRKNKIPQREVASILEIDTATYCKIENGDRRAKREQIPILADFFKVDEKELQNDFLSDVIAYKILDEEADLSILKVAEEKVKYLKTVHNGK